MDKRQVDKLRLGCSGIAAFMGLFAFIGAIGTFATVDSNSNDKYKTLAVFNDFARFGSIVIFIFMLFVAVVDVLCKSPDKMKTIAFAGGTFPGLIGVFLGSNGARTTTAQKATEIYAAWIVGAVFALVAGLVAIVAFVVLLMPALKRPGVPYGYGAPGVPPYGQPGMPGQPPMGQPMGQQFAPPAPNMAMGSWICSKCGAPNEANAGFCFGCGQKRS